MYVYVYSHLIMVMGLTNSFIKASHHFTNISDTVKVIGYKLIYWYQLQGIEIE